MVDTVVGTKHLDLEAGLGFGTVQYYGRTGDGSK